MRTISFDCPHCPGVQHCGAASIRRRCPCPVTGRSVYFTEDWRPLAGPIDWHRRVEALDALPAGYGWIRPSPPPRPLDPEWVVSALVTLGWMAALVLACLAIST
jgi:hypothetical protein